MRLRILFIICIFFGVLPSAGQTGRMFTTDKELSNSNIRCIFQDHEGIVWIGTEDGLNYYDGAEFRVLKHKDNDKSTLTDNDVRAVFEDDKGHFLVGTLRGLQQYDRETGLFKGVTILGNDGNPVNAHITKIIQRKNGEVLVSTSGYGVFSINWRKGNAYSKKKDYSLINSFVINIFEDKECNLWISMDGGGLTCLRKRGKNSTYFSATNNAWNTVTSIVQDHAGKIFIGTMDNGLMTYNPLSDSFVTVKTNYPNYPINLLYSLNDHEFCIGTNGKGLFRFNTDYKLLQEEAIPFLAFDFSICDVNSILKDRIGNLWLGIKGKGILLLPSSSNRFNYWGYKSYSNNLIGSSSVTAINKGHNGIIWIGTSNNGLYGVNLLTKKSIHFHSSGEIPSSIESIHEDSKQHLWLASPSEGLALMDTPNGRCRFFTLTDMKNRQTKRISCLAEDSKHRLWVGTNGGGLFFVDVNTLKITRMPSFKKVTDFRSDANILHNGWIISLIITQRGKLYIGTYDGLGCLDLETMNFVSTYKKNRLFSGMVVYSLFEDKNGFIWIGTSNGLIKLNEKTQQTTKYTMENGLPNNNICAIQGDKHNNLWISTNYGISHFIPSKGRFINYYVEDGLQGNEFCKKSAFTDTDGTIYWGGVNGVTYFNPKDITNEVRRPDIRISDFLIHNRGVRKGMKSGSYDVISSSVSQSEEFNLCHKDNSFSIELSAMEYYNPERIVYYYMFDDKHWVKMAEGVNRVSFSNLPAGKYKFQVKADNYGEFSPVKTIYIIIHPAWYATWWAKLLYFLLLCCIAAYIINQLRHRYKVRQEIQQHIHAEQINEAKLQFFINISHEIRTPMTLITSPLQQLMAMDANEEQKALYKTIFRNAQRILRLMNQLMDIRKIDKGQMNLLFKETEMTGFIQELCENFVSEANKKHIQLTFNHPDEKILLWIDPVNFDKIILNVISNAFKFTPEGGFINITLRTADNPLSTGPLQHYAEITISDSGIKIDEQKIEHIFERFYQIRQSQNNSNIGNGIGLHLSRSLVELHHGTIHAENNSDTPGCRFIIRIPLGKSHLSPEEIDDSKEEENILAEIQLPQEKETNDDKGKIKSKSKFSILIAEDDEEIRSYVCKELSKDFHILESSNGKEAWNLILKKNPDLVISDIMMPEMDGLTLCKKIKQNITINHIPVILLTAKNTEEDNLKGLDIGADVYMVKPFNLAILKSTAESLIRNREQLKNTFGGKQNLEDKVEKIEAQSPNDKLMERIMKVVNANLGNPDFSVEMITDEVGISRAHLHRKLKELTNQSARNFIRNIRLKKAAELLKDKKFNIAEVAELTGFAHTTYFSMAFKDLFGMSPTDYIEQQQQIRREEK